MLRASFVFCGLSGMMAVIMGAAASHWLVAAGFAAEDILRVEKASAWQMYHTLALLAALLLNLLLRQRVWLVAAMLFVLGILCFSGSLYLRALLGMPQVTAIAPIGGMAWMAGWIALSWGGFCCAAQKTSGQAS